MEKNDKYEVCSLLYIFSKFEHLNIFASIKSNMDSSAVTSVSQIGTWGNLPLAINTQTTVATSLLCLHNTTAINTVAHTASPHIVAVAEDETQIGIPSSHKLPVEPSTCRFVHRSGRRHHLVLQIYKSLYLKLVF